MIELTVKGMSCSHCEAAVRKALAGVDGVETVVTVDRERELASVEGSPDAQALISAIKAEGYEAAPR